MIAADSSGNGHDGTVVGDPQWSVEGTSGGAMGFDGDGDYLQTTLFEELHTAVNLTVSAWFKTNVTAEGQQHILWIGDVVGNGWGPESELHIGINHFGFSNKVVLFFGSGADITGQNINIVSLEGFTDTSGWHHLAGVIENANGPIVQGTLYLDSQVVEPFVDGFEYPTTDSTDLVPDRGSWNTDMRIGSPGPVMRYFNGMLDDVRVYTRALAQHEIATLSVPVDPRGQLTITWANVKAAR